MKQRDRGPDWSVIAGDIGMACVKWCPFTDDNDQTRPDQTQTRHTQNSNYITYICIWHTSPFAWANIPAYLNQFHDLVSVFFYFLSYFCAFFRDFRNAESAIAPSLRMNTRSSAIAVAFFVSHYLKHTAGAHPTHTAHYSNCSEIGVAQGEKTKKATKKTKRMTLGSLIRGQHCRLAQFGWYPTRYIHIYIYKTRAILHHSRWGNIYIYWVSFCLTQIQILDIVLGFSFKTLFYEWACSVKAMVNDTQMLSLQI